MVIDELKLDHDERGRVTHRFRVRGGGRDHWVEVTVPANLTLAMPDDATAALPLALLLAMHFGEDLDVAGWVDPDLHDRLDLIQAHYHAMNPSLDFVRVRVAGRLDAAQPPSAFAGSCLSRGVDSLYACAKGRTAAGPIDCAVFVDGLDPILDPDVRKQELDLVQRAADAIGLPLVVVEAPHLRPLTDGNLDWEDACGAGLAWIGHALAGGLSRFVVPSTDALYTLGPCGSSPVLDPLFSSRRLEIEHGDVVATRGAKVDWLARNRPDLLPLLKVCYMENRADNCGRCRKCLHAMICLRLAGVLEQASGFPQSIDFDALQGLALTQLTTRYDFAELHEAATRAGDRELAQNLARLIERTATAGIVEDESGMNTFRKANTNALLRLGRTGHLRFQDRIPVPVRAAHVGLLRTVDLRARRHSYATGGSRGDVSTTELGALIAPGRGGEIPVWTLADGRVVTDRYLPSGPTAGNRARVSFCAQPLLSGEHPLARRIRLALRRIFDAFLVRPPAPAYVPDGGGPVGYLLDEARRARVPLWSGVHPVIGDQLLTWSSDALERAGYVDATLLGYLVATSPHTGQLGTASPPFVPWAGAGQAIVDEPRPSI